MFNFVFVYNVATRIENFSTEKKCVNTIGLCSTKDQIVEEFSFEFHINVGRKPTVLRSTKRKMRNRRLAGDILTLYTAYIHYHATAT